MSPHGSSNAFEAVRFRRAGVGGQSAPVQAWDVRECSCSRGRGQAESIQVVEHYVSAILANDLNRRDISGKPRRWIGSRNSLKWSYGNCDCIDVPIECFAPGTVVVLDVALLKFLKGPLDKLYSLRRELITRLGHCFSGLARTGEEYHGEKGLVRRINLPRRIRGCSTREQFKSECRVSSGVQEQIFTLTTTPSLISRSVTASR